MSEPTEEAINAVAKAMDTNTIYARQRYSHLARALDAFAARAVAAEREACAAFIDEVGADWKAAGDAPKGYAADYLAAAIREGGKR